LTVCIYCGIKKAYFLKVNNQDMDLLWQGKSKTRKSTDPVFAKCLKQKRILKMKQNLLFISLMFLLMLFTTGCISVKKISDNSYTLDLSKVPYVEQEKWHSNYGELSLMKHRISSGYILAGKGFKNDIELTCKKITKTEIYRLNGFDLIRFEGITDKGKSIEEIVTISSSNVIRTILDGAKSRIIYKKAPGFKSLIRGELPGSFDDSSYYVFGEKNHFGPLPPGKLGDENMEFFQNFYLEGTNENNLPISKMPSSTEVKKPEPMKKESYKTLSTTNEDVIPGDEIRITNQARKIKIKMD